MSKRKEISIPLTGPDRHPVAIHLARNERHQRYDLEILVGNFKTEADAREYGNLVVQFLKDNADGKVVLVQ